MEIERDDFDIFLEEVNQEAEIDDFVGRLQEKFNSKVAEILKQKGWPPALVGSDQKELYKVLLESLINQYEESNEQQLDEFDHEHIGQEARMFAIKHVGLMISLLKIFAVQELFGERANSLSISKKDIVYEIAIENPDHEYIATIANELLQGDSLDLLDESEMSLLQERYIARKTANLDKGYDPTIDIVSEYWPNLNKMLKIPDAEENENSTEGQLDEVVQKNQKIELIMTIILGYLLLLRVHSGDEAKQLNERFNTLEKIQRVLREINEHELTADDILNDFLKFYEERTKD